MLTSFGALTITVRTPRPASARAAPGAASAGARSSSSPIVRGRLPAGLAPCSVYLELHAGDGVLHQQRRIGHWARMPGRPTCSLPEHFPALLRGVRGEDRQQQHRQRSRRRRLRGRPDQPAPGPGVNGPAGSADQLHPGRATATFSRVDSTSLVTSSIVLCVASAQLDVARSGPPKVAYRRRPRRATGGRHLP